MTKTVITIVGGGACGVAIFIDLVLKIKLYDLKQQVKIYIIEKSKEIGQGLAFGTKQPGHILNTRADLMGIHAFEPAHFSEWLQDHKVKSRPERTSAEDMDEAHATRRLYGEYLQDQFFLYYKRAQAENIEVEIVYDEAENITRSGNQWQVLLRSNVALFTDYLILAPGTPKPNNYPELEGRPGYINFPWPSEPILKIPQNAEVGILGSSLSAVDTVMTLADNNHLGKITLYSPEGLLPRVQPKGNNQYERQYLTLTEIHKMMREKLKPPTVKELYELFQKEAEYYEQKEINWKKTRRIGDPAQELLLQDIATAEAGGDAFINLIYALRYDASTIWKWIPANEKQKFLRWLGLYWNINRHAMPLFNAYRLRILFEDGQLESKPKLKEVNFSSENYIISYNKSQDKVKYLINATGPAYNIDQMKSKLVQNLKKQEIIEAYKPGGIRIDPESMQVISSQAETENLYAVGHLCNGTLLDVNAVWFNVKTIDRMCEVIIKKIGRSS